MTVRIVIGNIGYHISGYCVTTREITDISLHLIGFVEKSLWPELNVSFFWLWPASLFLMSMKAENISVLSFTVTVHFSMKNRGAVFSSWHFLALPSTGTGSHLRPQQSRGVWAGSVFPRISSYPECFSKRNLKKYFITFFSSAPLSQNITYFRGLFFRKYYTSETQSYYILNLTINICSLLT